MNQLDIYYRAFADYRKQTLDVRECIRQRKTFRNNGVEFDKLEAVKYLCTIKEDWVKAIEEGLVHIEKAVGEERQFIRTNGEIVPIEKVKKVSKSSVEHLAKHSNLITHIPENPSDTIIPDQLYIVEKLSDYAVYENRFLYMLLCYLRDFIDLRLDKILGYRMKYILNMNLTKNVSSDKRMISYETKFYEERTDNPYPLPDNLSTQMLNRIESCQRVVLALLNTPLMAEVSKTPMVKPPIVKTNVLKMNNNFKNALALYDYIASYKGDGFEIEEVKIDLTPFNDFIGDEIAEMINLTCFLTYKYGNDLEKSLKESYEEEEYRRSLEEANKIVEQLKKLKRKIAEEGYSIEEYLVLLEKRNRMLEKDSEDLIRAHNEISLLNKKILELELDKEELNRKIVELQGVIEEKIKEIEYLNEKYIKDMEALRRQHALEIKVLNEKHALEINDLNEKHTEEVNSLLEKHEFEMCELKCKYDEEINVINDNHSKYVEQLNSDFNKEKTELIESHLTEVENIKLEHIEQRKTLVGEHELKIEKLTNELKEAYEYQKTLTSNYDDKVKGLNEEIVNSKNERNNLINDYESKLNTIETNYVTDEKLWNETKEKLIAERDLAYAELKALRVEHGMISPCEDYTSKERFAELEHEFEIFNQFFKEQWDLTKKSIRKMILWTKEEKKEKNTKKIFTK